MTKLFENITVTQLRANLYKVLDYIIENRKAVFIHRKGYKIVIGLEHQPSIFDMLPKKNLTPPGITENELIHHDLGAYKVDPLLYNTDDPDLLIAAEPGHE